MNLLINVDVPDLAAAVAFNTEAFGLAVTRRFGADGAELDGWPARLYLLQKSEGSVGAAASLRRYDRHWTPVHLDVVVEDVEAALARSIAAGPHAETEIKTAAWGKIVTIADPFGHGLCLIEFLGRGLTRSPDRQPLVERHDKRGADRTPVKATGRSLDPLGQFYSRGQSACGCGRRVAT